MGRPPPGGTRLTIQFDPPSLAVRVADQEARAACGPGLTRAGDTQRGITGLETAIIMIAFIVVASVFAMTALRSGLFAADQGQQTAYAGLDQATGSLQLRGSVRAVRGDIDVDGDNTINLGGADDQAVVKVIFTVTGAIGSSLIDLTPPYAKDDTGTDPDASGLSARTSISLRTDTLSVNDLAWTVTFPGSDNGDFILDNDEKAEITAWLHSYDNVNALYDLGAGGGDPYIDNAADLAGAGAEFTLQLHPPKGATLNIQRTAPSVLRPQMDLR